MIIISHRFVDYLRGAMSRNIQQIPDFTLYFANKATQIGKRYYFSSLKKVNHAFIVNFTLKIQIVPQQELWVLGGETSNFLALLRA